MTRQEWYNYPRKGPCESCGKKGYRQAHHVVREQDVMRKDPSRRWDIANRMMVGPFCCHYGHTHYGVNDTRLSYKKVPEAAKQFAVEVFGEGWTINYFRRYYRDAP